MEHLKLDHYSGFEGEAEIRFYANSKDVKFELNRRPNLLGGYDSISLRQGERGIFFFSMWDGNFGILMKKLIDSNEYDKLPSFIKEWNEQTGWMENNMPPKQITNSELEWLLSKAKLIADKTNNEGTPQRDECMSSFLIFLETVKQKEMELRISEE